MASGRNHSTSPNDSYELFVQVFAQHEPSLRAFVRPLVPTWEDMQEVIQQTCLVLVRKFAEFEPESNFLAWACTIARFEALKHRRAMARDRHVFSEELLQLLADEGMTETERRERERRALTLCVETLDPPQREMIERCYGGAPIRSVAESLGRSATGLYKALARIRMLLLDCIESRLADEAVP